VIEMSHTKVYTTGVLNNVGTPAAVDAHIEVFNLDDKSHSVTVEVFNWDTAENGSATGPASLSVVHGTTLTPGNTILLQPNRWEFFTASVNGVQHYEVRITLDSDNVIANAFGRALGGTAIAAQRVLFQELVKVDLGDLGDLDDDDADDDDADDADD
jgi:hypothetical protein